MFHLDCHRCDHTYLVGPGSIASFHNTSEGPVAYVTCPEGHRLVRHFRSRWAMDAGSPTSAEKVA